MNVNDIVEFKRTKNRYRIAGFGKMKDPNGKDWLDSVVYENFQIYKEEFGYVPPEKSEIFTRELKDFESKFELSIPKVQIFDSRDGRMVYDFGLGEFILSRYFDNGFGLRNHIKYSEEKDGDVGIFCQRLAGDILIGEMKKADGRISQELLDAIRKDIKGGVFPKTTSGLGQIQNLLYFLSIPESKKEEETAAEGEPISEPLENIEEVLTQEEPKEETPVEEQDDQI